MSRTETTVRTRLRKTFGQDVHRPATHELDARQLERARLVAGIFVFAAGPESDFSVFVRNQSLVRNRAAGHVPRQVLQHMRGIGMLGRWWLDEDTPILLGELVRPIRETRLLDARQSWRLELNLPLSVKPFQTGSELLAEAAAEFLVVYEVRLQAAADASPRAGDPLLTIERGSAAGHQSMQVDVCVQRLVSRVQHHQRRRFDLQLLPHHVAQGFPSRVEQQVENLATVAQRQTGQQVGQREDDLEVINSGQQQLGRLIQPVRSSGSRTLRTMAVGARVIDLTLMLAAGTLVGVTTQGLGAAKRQLRQHALNLRRRLTSVPPQESGRVLTQDIDYSASVVGPLCGGLLCGGWLCRWSG